MLLHAWRLDVMHPVTGLPLCLEAPSDAQRDRLLAELGWAMAQTTIADRSELRGARLEEEKTDQQVLGATNRKPACDGHN